MECSKWTWCGLVVEQTLDPEESDEDVIQEDLSDIEEEDGNEENAQFAEVSVLGCSPQLSTSTDISQIIIHFQEWSLQQIDVL